MFAKEGNVNRSLLRPRALLTISIVCCCATVCQAGLFDWFKPKAKPTRARTTVAATRAQSPGYDAGAGTWQQPPAAPGMSYPWRGESGAAYGYGAAQCCGPVVRHEAQVIRCREKCDQTYYTPIPPYCFPCYGHNPTCWRRMPECNTCQRDEPVPPARPRRAAPPSLEPPAADMPPATDEPPNPMDETSLLRSRARAARLAAATAKPAVKAPIVPVKNTRWTGYADALPEEDEAEDEIPEAPIDSLEERIEAEEAPADEIETEHVQE